MYKKRIIADTNAKKKSGDQMTEVVYIALRERVQVTQPLVTVKDVADVYTQNQSTVEQIQGVPLFAFVTENTLPKKRKGRIRHYKATRQIISMLRVIQEIQRSGISHLLLPTGEQDCIVEYIGEKVPRKFWEFWKLFFVCLICLAGGAFSIMAFHNDISLPDMFQKFYTFVTGMPSDGNTLLEFMYSIGLGIGIVVFYNHVGKRRISKDPTPIEVSMRTYEQEMNSAMVKDWEREGKIIDVSP